MGWAGWCVCVAFGSAALVGLEGLKIGVLLVGLRRLGHAVMRRLMRWQSGGKSVGSLPVFGDHDATQTILCAGVYTFIGTI
jgi:hypothetical protein